MAEFNLQNLKVAIHTFLAVTANSFKTAIGGRLYDTQDEEEGGTTYPYCVYSFLPGAMDRDNSTKYEKPICRFTLYSDAGESTAITQAAAYLDSRFDECEASLTGITGMTILDVRRISTLSNLMKTSLGNWQLVIDYEIHIQRT